MIKQCKSRCKQKENLHRLVLIFVFSLSFSTAANSQIYVGDEENFAFKVKQIDEFFERFNNSGTLIKDYILKNYDGLEVSRKDLLNSLFDLKSTNITKEEVVRFISFVDNPQTPVNLSFYDENWYARVKCSVVYHGKDSELLLMLRVQHEQGGSSKWVVHQVYAEFLNTPDENNPYASLNPMSHATNFLGLNRAFEDPENLKAYLTSSFLDDQLSKFAIEMQHNRISFKQVEDISYHFFQVDGWIFSVENFQRSEKNSGWLISRLLQANTSEKEAYKQYLLREKI